MYDKTLGFAKEFGENMEKVFEEYSNWAGLNVTQRIEALKDCVKFYEIKTVQFIMTKVVPQRRMSYKKIPVKLEITTEQVGGRDVSFSDNIVYVVQTSLLADKKQLFYDVAKNTICAVFLNMFSNTSTDPSSKTRFGTLASNFLATITSEFGQGTAFEQDIMQAFEMSMSMATEMTTGE